MLSDLLFLTLYMPDVFGQILLDAARGEEAVHTIERDDGRVEEYSGSQYVEPIEKWNNAEREAIVEVKGRVLDIGCGAGRVMSFLKKKGHEVIGIDISEDALKACRMQGQNNVRLMSAEELDFPNGYFDTAILYGANFGVLGKEERIIGMLKELHRVTRPDAAVLASSRDASATENPQHLTYHEHNRKRGLPIGQIRIRLSYKGLTEDWHWLRFASPNEMMEISAKAGWKLSKTYGPPQLFVGVLHKHG